MTHLSRRIDLPGCIATAKTRKQLERQIQESIEFHIEGLRLHGEPVPKPAIETGKIAITASRQPRASK